MRICITGVKGFIGANLAKGAIEKGWDIIGIDLVGTKNPNALEALGVKFARDSGHTLWGNDIATDLSMVFDGNSADIIIHLAAESIVCDSQMNPRRTFETNVMGTVNILEVCRARNMPIVVASSDKCYGAGGVPFHESDPLRPRYPYDVSKACQDLIAQSYHTTYDLPVVVVRSSNVYGPGDLNWTRLVPHTCRAAIRGEQPRNHKTMWGVTREWIHVDDEVAALLHIAENLVNQKEMFANSYPALNIGSGEVASPSEIVPKILKAAGADVQPILEDVPIHELQDEAVDSTQLRRLGWKSFKDLDRGLIETVKWYSDYLGGA